MPKFNPSQTRRLIVMLQVVMLSSFFTSFQLSAQEYPTKRVTVIVPYAAGGGYDVIARIIAERLAGSIGVPVTIENKPGAYGNIGASSAAKSAADGYTLVILGTIQAVNSSFFKNIPFSLEKDFVPLVEIGDSKIAFISKNEFPVTTVPEFLAYAQSHPGKISVAAGGGAHPIELLKALTGVQVTVVPYTGATHALSDLLGGHVDMMVGVLPNFLPHIQSGRVRAIGIASRERAEQLPDVATFGETIDGFQVSQWYGLFAPANTSVQIVEQLRIELEKVRKAKSVQEKLAAQGVSVSHSTSSEFAKIVSDDLNKWRAVAEKNGISYD